MRNSTGAKEEEGRGTTEGQIQEGQKKEEGRGTKEGQIQEGQKRNKFNSRVPKIRRRNRDKIGTTSRGTKE